MSKLSSRNHAFAKLWTIILLKFPYQWHIFFGIGWHHNFQQRFMCHLSVHSVFYKMCQTDTQSKKATPHHKFSPTTLPCFFSRTNVKFFFHFDRRRVLRVSLPNKFTFCFEAYFSIFFHLLICINFYEPNQNLSSSSNYFSWAKELFEPLFLVDWHLTNIPNFTGNCSRRLAGVLFAQKLSSDYRKQEKFFQLPRVFQCFLWEFKVFVTKFCSRRSDAIRSLYTFSWFRSWWISRLRSSLHWCAQPI